MSDKLPHEARYSRAYDYRILTETLGELSIRHASVRIGILGTTLLDRPIPAVTIGKKQNSRSILYVGGLCPTDVLTPVLLLRFIGEYAELLARGRQVSSVSLRSLFENRTIHIIPMLNPDGYEIRRHGASDEVVRERLLRQNGGEDFGNWCGNARGVDLRRNFTECAERPWDHETVCPQGSPGLSPESEPETAALCNYLRVFDEITAVLSLHAENGTIRCFSADRCPPRSRTAARLLARLTGCTAEPVPKTACEPSGSPADWFIRTCGRPAFDFGCLIAGAADPSVPDDSGKIYTAFREALFSAPLIL